MPRNERISFFRNLRNPNHGSSLKGIYYRQLLQVTLMVFWQQREVLTRLILGEDERKVLLHLLDAVKDCL